MAYAAVVTVTQVSANEYEVLVSETDCGTANVATIDGIPFVGSVVRVSAELLSGTGTTIDPIATRTNPPASADETDVIVVPVSTPAATIDVTGAADYSTGADGAGFGRMFHSARCDAGANNVVKTLYRIRANVW